MTFQELKSLVEPEIPDAIAGEDLQTIPEALLISKEYIHQVCELLHSHEKTYFDQLSCLTGIDNGPESGTMELIYNLYSIPYNLHLMLKVSLNRKKPLVDSVHKIWRNANWYEREVYDLFGIQFKNHPDLRRILLPSDWVGYPLRKDYEVQEYYHGITVKYDRDEAPSDLNDLERNGE